MDAAKENDIGIRIARLIREPEGIADEIGNFLDLLDLIIVSQNDRVLAFFQLKYLLLQGIHHNFISGHSAIRSSARRRFLISQQKSHREKHRSSERFFVFQWPKTPDLKVRATMDLHSSGSRNL